MSEAETTAWSWPAGEIGPLIEATATLEGDASEGEEVLTQMRTLADRFVGDPTFRAELDVNAAVTLGWGLARRRALAPGLWETLATQVMEPSAWSAALTGRSVSRLAWAAACMGYLHTGCMQALTLAGPRCLPTMPAASLVDLVWAYGVLNVRHPSVLYPAAERLALLAPELTPTQVAACVWALFAAIPLVGLRGLAVALVERWIATTEAHGDARLPPAALADAIAGFGAIPPVYLLRAHYAVWRPLLRDVARLDVRGLEHDDDTPPPRWVCRLLTGLAVACDSHPSVARGWWSRGVVRRLARLTHVVANAWDSLPPTDTVAVVRATTTLVWHHPGCTPLRLAAERLAVAAAHTPGWPPVPPRLLPTILDAMARLGHGPERVRSAVVTLVGVIAQRLSSPAVQAVLRPQEVACILCAVGRMGIVPGALIDRLALGLRADKNPRLVPTDVTRLCEAVLRLEGMLPAAMDVVAEVVTAHGVHPAVVETLSLSEVTDLWWMLARRVGMACRHPAAIEALARRAALLVPGETDATTLVQLVGAIAACPTRTGPVGRVLALLVDRLQGCGPLSAPLEEDASRALGQLQWPRRVPPVVQG